MVVVAIIGILATVAVPNFQKYQARARIAEAKAHLNGIFTVEQLAFADYGGYASCLNTLGVAGNANYYSHGFEPASGTGVGYYKGDTGATPQIPPTLAGCKKGTAGDVEGPGVSHFLAKKSTKGRRSIDR